MGKIRIGEVHDFLDTTYSLRKELDIREFVCKVKEGGKRKNVKQVED